MPDRYEQELNDLGKELFHDAVDITEDEIKKKTPVLTGHLRRMIHQEIENDEGPVKTAIIGTNVEYAPHVEYGTVKMAPRAMFRRGVEAAKSKIQRNKNKKIRKFLNDVVGILK